MARPPMVVRIRELHEKFGLEYVGDPRALHLDEVIFRIDAMFEEWSDYVFSVFQESDEIHRIINSFRSQLYNTLCSFGRLQDEPDLGQQYDALIDLMVFTMSTLYRQSMPIEKGFHEVMDANMEKERDVTSTKNKIIESYNYDLVKPEGWVPPNMNAILGISKPLPNPVGIIVLDGPDCAGKTTLAEALKAKYGAKIIHSTWSKVLETNMAGYLMDNLLRAKAVADAGGLVVIDRLWMSEAVYSDVYRDRDNWRGLPIALHQMLKDCNALNILVAPSSSTLYLVNFKKNLEAGREEMYHEKQREVFNAYWGLFTGKGDLHNHIKVTRHGLVSEANYAHYDYTTDGTDLNAYCFEVAGMLRLLNPGAQPNA